MTNSPFHSFRLCSDDLSSQSTTYLNAFCTSPNCSPSRSSLLTGLFPHQNGHFGLANVGPDPSGWQLKSDIKTLPQLMKLKSELFISVC